MMYVTMLMPEASLFENAAKNKKLFHPENQGAYLQNG
jgi:hypothetical protein